MVNRLEKLFLCLLALICGEVVAQEVKWTPNESEEPSLPMSMKQRQQLKKLEEVIRQSPDPDATLKKAAEANGLSAGDLASMLQKNSQDLSENPSLAQPTTIPRAVLKIVTTLSSLVMATASKHPRPFAVTMFIVLFFMYAMFAIPRTGFNTSTKRSILSSSPTCFAQPPQKYLQFLADVDSLTEIGLSIQKKKMDIWDGLTISNDGVKVHALPRKSPLVLAVSARISLQPDSIIPEEFNSDDNDDIDDIEREQALKLLYESCANLLSSRKFAEIPSEKLQLRVASMSDRPKFGIMAVPGLGDFGRWGLVYWVATQQVESEKDFALTLTTLKTRAAFDGQIQIHVQRLRSKLLVRTHLVVPKGGKKIPKKTATKLVEALAESLVSSASQRTKQIMARKIVSRAYKSASHRRATERRNSRFEREKLIEEMAEDRRRKWQRNNDAGRYRPSGKRLQSPNNCLL